MWVERRTGRRTGGARRSSTPRRRSRRGRAARRRRRARRRLLDARLVRARARAGEHRRRRVDPDREPAGRRRGESRVKLPGPQATSSTPSPGTRPSSSRAIRRSSAMPGPEHALGHAAERRAPPALVDRLTRPGEHQVCDEARLGRGRARAGRGSRRGGRCPPRLRLRSGSARSSARSRAAPWIDARCARGGARQRRLVRLHVAAPSPSGEPLSRAISRSPSILAGWSAGRPLISWAIRLRIWSAKWGAAGRERAYVLERDPWPGARRSGLSGPAHGRLRARARREGSPSAGRHVPANRG